MKKLILTMGCMLAAGTALAQYASQTFIPCKPADVTVAFATDGEGEDKPILWGLDTAWPSEENIRRGVRYIGAENIGVARVSFQPWDYMLESTTLTDRLEANLRERLRLVSFIGGTDRVKIVLNNDAPGDVYDTRYSNPADNADALTAYCNLIYGTTLSCQAKGWEVITASPLNEPDYVYNGQGSQEDFLAIARKLKTEYPQYKDGTIRISGGNTLNCDQAMSWYTFLSDYIDEGNTHQLAGDFNHYADFFTRVSADGKYATADELHNVMEAMVGVEYGMQTGIWWGTAERARGEFCKASFGRRLAYGENRNAWSAAAVYRNPEGGIQAFAGCSERQARPSTYRLVSVDRDVFFNGYGPQREFLIELPGDPDGAYQTELQRNAECLVDITWGEDVSPVIDGEYIIMNKHSLKVLAHGGEAVNFAPMIQQGAGENGIWRVNPAPINIGGDFSYHTITLAAHPEMKIDVNNWTLEEKGSLILYAGGLGNNEQWYLKYAGDGYFRIFSRHSNLCLELAEESAADGVTVYQASPSDTPRQLWRFLPVDAPCETDAPKAPSALTATAQSASVRLDWEASTSADVASYTVLRAETATAEFTTVGRGVTTTYFIDNTVEPGKEYCYKVKAVDRSLNSSAMSGETSVTASAGNALVAWYPLNGDLLDATENMHHAVLHSDAVADFGNGRKENTSALHFSSDHSSLIHAPQIPFAALNHDETTVAAWIYADKRNGTQTIFSSGHDDMHYIALVMSGTGNLNVRIVNGSDRKNIALGNLPVQSWTHVALTVTPETVALYLNGELAGSADNSLGLALADIRPVSNYIGCDQARSTAVFLGAVEDLRIYNYAVDASELPEIMEGESGGVYAPAISASPVVASEYFTPSGVRVDNPAAGIYIIRRTHADGSVSTVKEVLR